MTREEAINEIKSWDFLNEKESEAVRTLIPELRESEEETTRKELLDFVRSFWADHKEKLPQVSRWVTYLEKQKVPEGLHPEEYPLTPDECVKPVEWSEKDKEMLMRCIAAIPVQGDEIMPTSYLNKLRNWLEFLPERFNPPTKQEWSETDEKMLTGIIERGSVQVPPYTTALREEQIEWLMNRLKSLRPQPHWKPSEEQIEALKFAVKLYKDTHFENNHEKIVSLYEQLKKLM